jgi:hypothetical protein
MGSLVKLLGITIKDFVPEPDADRLYTISLRKPSVQLVVSERLYKAVHAHAQKDRVPVQKVLTELVDEIHAL